MAKTRIVFVKCMVVDTDGTPVNRNGEPTCKPWYTWEERRRSNEWIANPKNKGQWKERR